MPKQSLFAAICASLVLAAPGYAQTTHYVDPAAHYTPTTSPMSFTESMRMAGLRDRLIKRLGKAAVQVIEADDHMMLRFSEHMLFDGAADNVSHNGIRTLTILTEELLQRPPGSVHVISHFHDSGDKFASQISSQRRAMSVVSVLDSRTLPREWVEVTAMGASYPVNSNHTTKGRADNRRVEIILRPAPSATLD